MTTLIESASLINEFREIVEAVFKYMLDLPITVEEEQVQQAPEALQSSVQLRGDWNGMVIIQCSREVAGLFAEHFLSTCAEDIPEALVLDVLRELANIVAGNLKFALGPHIELSAATPRPLIAADMPKDSNVEQCARLRCAAGPFCIALVVDPTRSLQGSYGLQSPGAS